jgi:hypothetical protein
MKVYIIMEEDRGTGPTIHGVYLSKKAAEDEWGGPIEGNYYLEESELNMNKEIHLVMCENRSELNINRPDYAYKNYDEAKEYVERANEKYPYLHHYIYEDTIEIR